MDYYHNLRNAVSRNKPVAFATTAAAALGVGYAYYYSRMGNIPLATRVRKSLSDLTSLTTFFLFRQPLSCCLKMVLMLKEPLSLFNQQGMALLR